MSTYFITQAGAGAHNGSSLANADSVAHHNAATYAADDIIYLCDTIISTIVPPSPGAAGHPIVYRGDWPGHLGVIDGTDNTLAVGFGSATDGVYEEYLTIQSLEVKNCTSMGIVLKTDDPYTDNLSTVINLCNIHDIGAANDASCGIKLNGAVKTITNCTIDNIGGDAIYLIGLTTTITGCTITRTSVAGILGDCIQIGSGYDSSNFTISNNTLDHSNLEVKHCIVSSAHSNGLIENNTLIGAEIALNVTHGTGNAGTGLIIRNNQFINNGKQSIATSSNSCQIYNNYFTGSGSGLTVPKDVIYIMDSFTHDGAVGTQIYNNTIYNSGGVGIYLANTNALATIDIRNNIISGVVTRFLANMVAGPTVTTSNNWYYNSAAANKFAWYDTALHYYTSLELYQAAQPTQEVGSGSTDPLLTTHILLPDSPCIRAGLTIDLVTNDIDGRKRPGRPGNKYSIGAWEYLGTNDPDRDEVCRLPYR